MHWFCVVRLSLTELKCEDDVVSKLVVRPVERQLDGEFLAASEYQLRAGELESGAQAGGAAWNGVRNVGTRV